METSIFLLMIFIIIILIRQERILEEDKYCLREDNISLRNDLKRVLLREDNSNNKPRKGKDRKNKKQKKENKPKKAVHENSRIYIFKDARSEEEAEKILSLRNFLKEHSVNKVIMVCFEDLLPKLLDDEDESVIEEIFLLDDNLDNFPIIFYGADFDEFLDFMYFCCWEDRDDIEWIENPWNIEDIKQALKEIKKRQII